VKSPRDHITSGLKSVGFDGGLDSKTDPIQVPPPKVTTNDNVWHITPGQARQLPQGGAQLLPNTRNCHTLFSPPVNSSAALAVQNAYPPAPLGGPQTGHTQPQLIDPTNPTFPLSGSPCYQANFRTRLLGTTASIASSSTPDTVFVTPDLPASGSQPYALISPTYGSVGTFTISTGDLATGASTPNVSYDVGSMVGSYPTAKTIVTFRAEPVPGDNTLFALAFQTGSSSFLYVAFIPYSNPGCNGTLIPFTILSMGGGNVASYILFPEGQKLWAAYLYGTSNYTLKFQQVSNTGGAGAVRSGTTVTGTGLLTAKYLDGVGMCFAYSTTAEIDLYFIDDAVWQAGNTTTSYSFAAFAGSAGSVDNTAVTIGLAKSDTFIAPTTSPVARGIGPVSGTVFFHALEAMTSGTSLSTYGVGQPTLNRIGIRNFGTDTTTTFANLQVQALLYYRTPVGMNIMGECFSPNYAGPGGRAGDNNSGDFICPIVSNYHYSAVSAVSVFTQPRYFLINSQCNVVGRWADDAGGPFYPSANTVLRKTCAAIAPNDNSSLEFYIPFALNSQLRYQAAQPASGGATYLGAGLPNYNNITPALAIWSNQAQHASCPPVASGKSTVLSGPLTMLYDGQTLHEAGFHLRPHPPIIGTITPNATSGTTITTTINLVSATVSSTTGLYIGQSISCANIASGTIITDIQGTTITLSIAATATGSAASLATICQYQYILVYRWVDAQGLVHRSAPSLPTQVNFNSGPTNFGSVNLGLPIPDATYKLGGASQIWVCLYRTVNFGRQFYSVASFPINQVGNKYALASKTNLSKQMTDFFFTQTDGATDQSLNNNIAAGSQVVEDFLYTSLDGSYASFAPPPFLWQLSSGGRHYGLACVDGFNRVYFSQSWDESSPPEWNNFCYLPVPAELGDCRSLSTYQNNIFIHGTRGIATFSGAGPSRQLSLNSDGTLPDGAALASLYNGNFTQVTPIPTPAGVRGTGSPVTMPLGVIYQDRTGFMVIDGSLNPQYAGAGVEALTGTFSQYAHTIYGPGTLCESLQAIVWANSQGAALVFDYIQTKWSTWSAASNIKRFVSSIDKSVYVLTTQNVQQVNQFGTTLIIETPWLSPSPNELDVGYTNSYSSNVGEGNIWEAELYGLYVSPHTIKIETAINYGPYQTGKGFLTNFAVTAAPEQYQYRLRPPRTSRIWAIRYRITLIPPTNGVAEMARLSGVVLYSAVDSSVTRLGRDRSA
jgi:hypothetical protein